jgi:hypothetical protein
MPGAPPRCCLQTVIRKSGVQETGVGDRVNRHIESCEMGWRA